MDMPLYRNEPKNKRSKTPETGDDRKVHGNASGIKRGGGPG